MDHGVKYSKSENDVELDATEYRKMVGCSWYLLHTRPDMAYFVGIVSRYMQSLCESHDEDDGRSTIGHAQSPITWCSQKQATVAFSSCEAEYMAISTTACQAVWLRELLSELIGEDLQKVVLKIDNTSA
ncbi:secreted RxLR effector protein 161-like [Bidens hawaiensis]|uniref:secreted RxLR effector protein 161-like n=1 Tax=Bidens hawaiensis TaxID=980011 RepID=UPI00404A25BB